MNEYKRFWEVDSVRGGAVLMMLFSNLITDLNYFTNLHVPFQTFWWWFARCTASIFLFISGVCLTLSYSKSKKFSKFFKRGVRIFTLGLIITLITYLLVPGDVILFGVLHLIGTASIITYPLINKPLTSLTTALLILLSSLFTRNIVLDSKLLTWLGIRSQEFHTLDYFPIIPWLGIILLGVYTGSELYKGYERRFRIIQASDSSIIKVLTILGRNSLLIYFLHQPVILSTLYLLGLVSF